MSAMQVSGSFVLCVLSALNVVPNTVSATWTTSWAIQIQSASDIDVNGLAAKHGFANLGLVRSYVQCRGTFVIIT